MNKAGFLRLNKSEVLRDAPLYYDVIICNADEPSYSQAFVNDLMEISVVVSGKGNLKVLGQIIPCEAGDVFLIPSHLTHEYFLSEDGGELKARRFLFDLCDWFGKEVATRESPNYCFGAFYDNSVISYARLNTQTLNKVNGLFDELVEEIAEEKREQRRSVEAYLSLLLITLGRYVSNTIQNITDDQQGELRIMSAAVSLLMERFYDSELTLEMVADALFVSQSSLSRLFMRHTGEKFSQYLKNLRLDHACELLKDTSLNIDIIVKQCGLKDVSSFYQNFSAYIGKTPNQYRNQFKKNKHKDNTEDRRMVVLSEISENLQKGKSKIVKELVQQAIDEGMNPGEILEEGLLAGMSVIGEKFKNNEIYVPEVLVAARAMNMGAQILKPHLVASGIVATGRVCIGTVQGDLHDIGKNIVKMMMEGKGLEVIDLGTDVAAETFVKTAIEQECQIICCSALLTTTMGVMEEVVKAAEAAGIRDKVKIMVGGAPVNEDFCKKIGADCYTVDAASAADAAAEFCKG